jgi:hypothetical protein
VCSSDLDRSTPRYVVENVPHGPVRVDTDVDEEQISLL